MTHPVLAAFWGPLLFFFAVALPVAGLIFAFVSVGASSRFTTAARSIQAAGLVLMSVVLIVVVRSEDTYLNNGTTVWDFHQGAHAITIAAVSLGIAVAVTLLAVRQRGLTAVALGASSGVAVLQIAALVANSGD